MPEFPTLMIFAAAALVLTATPSPDMPLIASRKCQPGPVRALFDLCRDSRRTLLQRLRQKPLKLRGGFICLV